MSEQRSRFAVVGAGNAGQAIAGDLMARGHRVVALYDKFEDVIDPIRERGGVELVGPVASGFYPVHATTQIQDGISEADVVIVVVPATAHAAVARDVARVAHAKQTVVVCPGYVGGALLFRRELHAGGLQALPMLAETTTMPFSSRLVGPGQVGIKGIKRVLHLAALPSSDTAEAVERLRPAFRPALIAAANVWEAGLNNPNPITHVPLTVMNWGQIEDRTFEKHFDYHTWITPGVARVSEALDQERVAVMRALGLTPVSHEAFHAMSYDAPWHIVEAKGALPASSWTIPPRFVDEDVPCGLIPISSLGALLGVATPMTNALIRICSLMRNRDYWSEGRTDAALAIGGLAKEDLLRLVH